MWYVPFRHEQRQCRQVSFLPPAAARARVERVPARQQHALQGQGPQPVLAQLLLRAVARRELAKGLRVAGCFSPLSDSFSDSSLKPLP